MSFTVHLALTRSTERVSRFPFLINDEVNDIQVTVKTTEVISTIDLSYHGNLSICEPAGIIGIGFRASKLFQMLTFMDLAKGCLHASPKVDKCTSQVIPPETAGRKRSGITSTFCHDIIIECLPIRVFTIHKSISLRHENRENDQHLFHFERGVSTSPHVHLLYIRFVSIMSLPS
jgi:hypothetical protein